MTGLFSLLVGYALEFPVLYNTENGRAGVGVFGLMDYGSNNGRGVIPAPPTPWTRSLPDPTWSNIINIKPVFNQDTTFTIPTLSSENIVYKINVSKNEYFMIEK